MSTNRTYNELIRIPTFEERFEYLRLMGVLGESTFGFDRYLNQRFYHLKEWKDFRNRMIVRDEACDLGVQGRDIVQRIILHHINPITLQDLEERRPILMDPNNVICTSHDTHNAIHFGDASLLPKDPIIRRKGDTTPWLAF